MPITLNQHRANLTRAIIATFSDDKAPAMGLGLFFPQVTSRALELAIEVERNRQLVAVDVKRCTDSNRNTFSNSTEKLFIPPFYNESFDFTKCQGYAQTFGMGVGPQNGGMVDLMVGATSRYLKAVKNKIERAIEKQRASVLQTGTVLLKNGDSIDYRRKALSMPVLSGDARWSQTATATKLLDLQAGGTWLRQEGLISGNEINLIAGGTAMGYLLADAEIQKERAIFSSFRRADIGLPRLDTATGLTFNGRIATGDFIYNLWTYSDFYENADGSKSPYIDTNTVVFIPNDFEGKTAFGGIPRPFNDGQGNQSIQPVEADFLVYDLIDPKLATWEYLTQSAPLVIPVSVDRLYTLKVA